jgi:hypothetical protein
MRGLDEAGSQMSEVRMQMSESRSNGLRPVC